MKSDAKPTPGIRERSPGHFELRAYNRATGKQETRTYTDPRGQWGAGIRGAKAELAKLVVDIAAGKYGGSAATLGHLLDQWIRHGESRGRSPNTIFEYKAKARRIKAGPLADKTVSKLTAHDLDDYYLKLQAEGMSKATVVHYHRIIRAALNQAEKWDWVTSNVARKATIGTAPRVEMNVPTIDQARALIIRASATTSPEFGPIILFAILTGMRRGELCAIQWGDVDWEERRITVRRSVWQRATWGIKDPKTHQVRTLALDEAGIALLAARKARVEEDAEAAGIKLKTDGYVWSTSVDGHSPRSPNSLTRAFHRLCNTMETEALKADPSRVEKWDFRFHDLRHLSATEMVGQGYDPRTVASRLGHADPSVTLRVYAHALEARDRDAADGLGRALALPVSS